MFGSILSGQYYYAFDYFFSNTGVILAAFIELGNLLISMDLFNSWHRNFLEISRLSLMILTAISESCKALKLLFKFVDLFFNI